MNGIARVVLPIGVNAVQSVNCYVLADGASAEIGVVGNEGIIGVSLFMGGETTPSRAVVQSAGFAYRWSGKFLKEVMQRRPVKKRAVRQAAE